LKVAVGRDRKLEEVRDLVAPVIVRGLELEVTRVLELELMRVRLVSDGIDVILDLDTVDDMRVWLAPPVPDGLIVVLDLDTLEEERVRIASPVPDELIVVLDLDTLDEVRVRMGATAPDGLSTVIDLDTLDEVWDLDRVDAVSVLETLPDCTLDAVPVLMLEVPEIDVLVSVPTCALEELPDCTLDAVPICELETVLLALDEEAESYFESADCWGAV
jgi:hypothetical protein